MTKPEARLRSLARVRFTALTLEERSLVDELLALPVGAVDTFAARVALLLLARAGAAPAHSPRARTPKTGN